MIDDTPKEPVPFEGITINRKLMANNYGLQGFDNPFPDDKDCEIPYIEGRQEFKRQQEEMQKWSENNFD